LKRKVNKMIIRKIGDIPEAAKKYTC